MKPYGNCPELMFIQLSEYSISGTSPSATQTTTPAVASPVESQASEVVTPQAAAAKDMIQEEKVEYRDQDGNLLNEDQVKALEGKVSFSTRYETKTRTLDKDGNEIADKEGSSSVAPPHPDVERIPGTKGGDAESRDSPASVSPEEDLSKEKSLNADSGKPKPGSEAQEATKV